MSSTATNPYIIGWCSIHPTPDDNENLQYIKLSNKYAADLTAQQRIDVFVTDNTVLNSLEALKESTLYTHPVVILTSSADKEAALLEWLLLGKPITETVASEAESSAFTEYDIRNWLTTQGDICSYPIADRLLTARIIQLARRVGVDSFTGFRFSPLTDFPPQTISLYDILHSLKNSMSYESMAALVRINIDTFKNINACFNHATGDATLREYASLLRQHFSMASSITRFDSDEFAIILPHSVEEAVKMTEDFRSSLATHEFYAENFQQHFQLSVRAVISRVDCQTNIDDTLSLSTQLLHPGNNPCANKPRNSVVVADEHQQKPSA